jgi:predicted anti-sigma-YlaC factor YlaD
MKRDCSCEELLELINEFIDGDLQGEQLEEAETLIKNNPQCRAMFHTVSQTIALYRSRRNEIEHQDIPRINWDKLENTIKTK